MITLPIVAVLGAAVLHASWNAVLRGGRDRLWSMTLMMASITVVTAAVLALVPWPDRASWPYVIASAVIHTFYNLALLRTYRSGDLGQTYPISRGSSPVLVALGAAVFAHEALGWASCLGIALVSAGILTLALGERELRAEVVRAALLTGLLIAAYTVVDGVGVRLSRSALSYTAGMFFLWSLTMPLLYAALSRPRPSYTVSETVAALGGGLVSLLAYGIVIWAMRRGAMGVMSALRETSVLYAVIIGRVFLGEPVSSRRIASCIAVAAGAACLAR